MGEGGVEREAQATGRLCTVSNTCQRGGGESNWYPHSLSCLCPGPCVLGASLYSQSQMKRYDPSSTHPQGYRLSRETQKKYNVQGHLGDAWPRSCPAHQAEGRARRTGLEQEPSTDGHDEETRPTASSVCVYEANTLVLFASCPRSHALTFPLTSSRSPASRPSG